MAKKIVITSGKGGVGKTTITANLGLALSELGARVLLVDIDFGLNNLDVVLGLENKVCYNIGDVLSCRCRLKQALVQYGDKKSLYILPSLNGTETYSISGQSIKLMLDSVDMFFDYIILDCPAGIDVGFHRAVSCANQAMVVVTPNLTSIRDADKVVSVLKSYRLDSINLIVNRARGDLIMSEKMMLPFDIEKILKTKLIGVLPEEDIVFLSSGYKISKKSDSFKAYKILANNLHMVKSKIFDATKKYSGFFGSIRGSIKSRVWEKEKMKLLDCNLLLKMTE